MVETALDIGVCLFGLEYSPKSPAVSFGEKPAAASTTTTTRTTTIAAATEATEATKVATTRRSGYFDSTDVEASSRDGNNEVFSEKVGVSVGGVDFGLAALRTMRERNSALAGSEHEMKSIIGWSDRTVRGDEDEDDGFDETDHTQYAYDDNMDEQEIHRQHHHTSPLLQSASEPLANIQNADTDSHTSATSSSNNLDVLHDLKPTKNTENHHHSRILSLKSQDPLVYDLSQIGSLSDPQQREDHSRKIRSAQVVDALGHLETSVMDLGISSNRWSEQNQSNATPIPSLHTQNSQSTYKPSQNPPTLSHHNSAISPSSSPNPHHPYHIINIQQLRRIVSQGIANNGSHRAVAWRVLSGYLPPDTSQWNFILNRDRSLYRYLVSELFVRPDHAIANQYYHHTHHHQQQPAHNTKDHVAMMDGFSDIRKKNSPPDPYTSYHQNPKTTTPTPTEESDDEITRKGSINTRDALAKVPEEEDNHYPEKVNNTTYGETNASPSNNGDHDSDHEETTHGRDQFTLGDKSVSTLSLGSVTYRNIHDENSTSSTHQVNNNYHSDSDPLTLSRPLLHKRASDRARDLYHATKGGENNNNNNNNNSSSHHQINNHVPTIPTHIREQWKKSGRDAGALEHIRKSIRHMNSLLVDDDDPTATDDSEQNHESSTSKKRVAVKDDPLNQDIDSEWAQFFENASLLDEIRKDVVRTHSDLQFFLEPKDNLGQRRYAAIERILFVWAKLNKGVRYVQGMNEIVGTIYFVLADDSNEEWACEAEADTYFLFNTLLAEMRDAFVPDLDHADTGIQGRISNMIALLSLHDPEVRCHLDDCGIDGSIYSIRWLTTLLSREFQLPDTIRLWDSMFASTHKGNFLRYVCVAMVMTIREDLLKGDFGACLRLLQSYPPTNIDRLLEASRALWIYESQITLACHESDITLHQALATITPPPAILMAYGLPGSLAHDQAREHLLRQAKERGSNTVSSTGQGFFGNAKKSFFGDWRYNPKRKMKHSQTT